MKTALILLIEAFSGELDRRCSRAPEARTAIQTIAEMDPEYSTTIFGEFVVGIMGYCEAGAAHALNGADAARIFDSAEISSLDVFGHRTDQTEAIDALWAAIVERLPEPESFNHQTEMTGYQFGSGMLKN